MPSARPSLADQLGGDVAVEAAVNDLYRRVLGDPALTAYFDDVDMAAQRDHMAAFLLAVLGRTHDRAQAAEARQLHRAHADLGITDDAFDRTAGHLLDTLAGLPVDPHLIDDVIVRIAAFRPAVVDVASAV